MFVIAAIALALAGCGTGNSSDQLQVYASDSLESFLSSFDRANPIDVHASSVPQLLEQTGKQSIADVLIVPDSATLARAQASGIFSNEVALASNRLVLAVPLDSPINDSAGLGGATVAYTASQAADAVLNALGVAKAQRKLMDHMSDVTDAVAGGDLEVGLVFATDVLPRSYKVRAVALPSSLDRFSVTTYVALVNTKSVKVAAAKAYVTSLSGTDAAALLMSSGFLVN